MDKKIEDLKQYYLSAKPPMEIGEGYADVLNRIDKVTNRKSIPIYAYAGFAVLLFVIGIGATILFPNNGTVTAVKAVTQKTLKVLFAPSVTPIPSPEIKTLKEKVPTPTPTAKTTPSPTPSSQRTQEKSGEKNENKKNSETKIQEVKGASDNSNPTVTPFQRQSEEHKNENSNEKSDNNNQDNSSENSKGKNKDD